MFQFQKYLPITDVGKPLYANIFQFQEYLPITEGGKIVYPMINCDRVGRWVFENLKNPFH